MGKIILPKGFFRSCHECFYADFNDKDSCGRVKCNGLYGGYNRPEDRNGCFHFKIYTFGRKKNSDTKIENNSADNED